MYSAPPKYAGTLRLVADDDACGTFEVGLSPPTDSRFFDADNIPIDPLVTESVLITVDCDAPISAASAPANCSVDHLQATEPDGTMPASSSFIDIRFNPCCLAALAVSDFSVREVPGLGSPLNIVDVESDPEGNGLEWTRVYLDRRLSVGDWTCVTVLPNEREFCVGLLPGDVDHDRAVDVFDLEALVKSINRRLPGLLRHCDIDRSGACGPKDLLRLADLLNGADAYESWEGRSLPACPSR